MKRDFLEIPYDKLYDKEVLGGWTFATTGYDVSASKPIYLSFDVGAGHPADELRLWHYDGSDWAAEC